MSDTTNVFTDNQCVGLSSSFHCVTGNASSFATIARNTYYVSGASGQPVCPTGPVENGSMELALPDDDGIVALAVAKLGMK